jgi:hypothetical protein
MDMDNATLEALRGSIAKWEGIVAGTVTNEGPYNCPLCQLFMLYAEDNLCEGCPVKERTGRTGCAETPYEDYAELGNEHTFEGSVTKTLLQQAAQRELEFLKSLLPNEPSHASSAEECGSSQGKERSRLGCAVPSPSATKSGPR